MVIETERLLLRPFRDMLMKQLMRSSIICFVIREQGAFSLIPRTITWRVRICVKNLVCAGKDYSRSLYHL